MIKPIPSGYNTITPYLVLADADRAIRFYTVALGAEERYRLRTPDGNLAHVELQIGDSRLMASSENPAWGARSARSIGGCPIGLCLYTKDVDALAERFVAAGGKVIRPLQDQFYGDRSGQFEDPEGYVWTLAQHIVEVAPAEMQRRMNEMMGG